MDEDKVRKRKGKEESKSIEAFIAKYGTILGIAPGAGLLIGKVSPENFDLRIPIIFIGGLFVGLGLLKPSIAALYKYKKIIYYEKKTGKKIRNGKDVKDT